MRRRMFIGPRRLRRGNAPGEGRVRAQNVDGTPYELDCEGLLAVCVQHEMDHLLGKVFVEYLSPLKQTRIRTRLKKRKVKAA